MATLSACWDWKVEPVSPGFTSPEHEVDFWGLDDDVTLVSPKVEKDEPTESKSAAELLDDFDDWIKEEPFAIWLEEKIDLPLLDIPVPAQETRVYSPSVRGNYEAVKPQTALEVKTPLQALQPPPQYVVPGDTQSLLQEFESVFVEVEHNFALTPPQSPTQPPPPFQITSSAQSQYSGIFSQDPNESPYFITTLQHIIPLQTVPDSTYQFSSVTPLTSAAPILSQIPESYVEKEENLIPNLEQIVPSPATDVDEELAVVDELIRTRVEDLETSIPLPQRPISNPQEFEADSSSPYSIHENVVATLDVTPPSPSTTSNSSFDSTEDDPDWVPLPVNGLSSPGCEKVTGGRKRAAKPYVRIGTEEKRQRKKEQNKNAATRYRQKKKAEVEVILDEEKQLVDTNEELQSKVNDLSREIKYLKGLMRDVFKAKGLLK